MNSATPHRLNMIAPAYLATLPLLIGWFLPFVVAGLGATMGFSEQSSGLLVSSDMLGYTLGTALTAPLLQKVNWRHAAQLCLALVVIANLSSCVIAGLGGLISIRLCGGFFSGVLGAIALSAAAQREDPESALGLWQVFQALAAIFAGLALPGLIEQWTARAAFVVIAVAAAAGFPLTWYIPIRATKKSNSELSLRRTGSFAAFIGAIVAVLLMLNGATAITAFLERIGTQRGLDAHTVGIALSVAGVASLIGGTAATRLGHRFGQMAPTLIGSALLCLSYLAYVMPGWQAAAFIVITGVFFGAYSYVAPYYLGSLAQADPSGRSVSLGNAALGAGLTLGPMLGGFIVTTGSTTILCAISALGTALAGLLALPLQFQLKAAAS